VQTYDDHSKGVLAEKSKVGKECIAEKQLFHNKDTQGTDSMFDKNKPSLMPQQQPNTCQGLQ
jgi:hypothetical protein